MLHYATWKSSTAETSTSSQWQKCSHECTTSAHTAHIQGGLSLILSSSTHHKHTRTRTEQHSKQYREQISAGTACIPSEQSTEHSGAPLVHRPLCIEHTHDDTTDCAQRKPSRRKPSNTSIRQHSTTTNTHTQLPHRRASLVCRICRTTFPARFSHRLRTKSPHSTQTNFSDTFLDCDSSEERSAEVESASRECSGSSSLSR